MKKIKWILLTLLGLLVIVYLLGPKPPRPQLNKDMPGVPDIELLDNIVSEIEAREKVRPDNEARIIWTNDSLHRQTEYCLLYLHGFSASYYEGFPTNVDFAQRYGCNAYFPRLASHGLVTNEPLIDMTPDRLWEDSKKALAVAHKLGKKVIIMGTSTGCTLALQLAADYPDQVDGLILYSPNIRINNSAVFLVSKPWGLQIARFIAKGKYRVTNEDFNSKECQYWDCKYRLEAVVYLQQLLEATMTAKTFKKVTAPVFVGYYFKDKENQDKEVKVSAMLDMFQVLGTQADKKVKQAFPNAGEHIIACELKSGALAEVKKATFDFAENILKMKPEKP